jgi:hypothetical protein
VGEERASFPLFSSHSLLSSGVEGARWEKGGTRKKRKRMKDDAVVFLFPGVPLHYTPG